MFHRVWCLKGYLVASINLDSLKTQNTLAQL